MTGWAQARVVRSLAWGEFEHYCCWTQLSEEEHEVGINP
jgi:hypothetical protein